MLVMGSKTTTVDGVTVFADHADPKQFWYLPAPVALAKRDGEPQFTLIRYRPAVANAGVQGGGFLTMEVELQLDADTERKIAAAVSRYSDGPPRLTPVPFDEGTVQIIALNIQGGGGTTATPPPPGAFVAVESVLGATKPSLGGSNNAVFSLTLSQEGSIILDQAFRQGGTPVGVIYDLKYTALRPALSVKITANFKRIYDKLSWGLDLTAGAVIYGVPVYLEAGIDMAFEKLKQEGVISVEVINFANAKDQADKETWALDFFKQYLLQQWFQPTLAPITFDRRPGTSGGGGTTPGGTTTPAGAGGSTSAGPATTPRPAGGGSAPAGGGAAAPAGGGAAAPARGGAAPAGGGTAPAGGGAAPASGGAAPAGGGAAPASGGAAPAGGGAAPAGGGAHGEAPEAALVRKVIREMWAYPFLETEGRQAARLDRRVEPETPGYDVQMTQTGESDQVTLSFLGGTDAPTVRIDSAVQALNEARQLTLEVAAGASHAIEAVYPPAAAATKEFRLYFDYDKPRAPGWSASPPSAVYTSYLNNQSSPLDSRFQTSTGNADGSPGAGGLGADALHAWLQSAVGSPRRVTIDAHASFEGDDSKAVLNQQLTERRLDVARGIIGSDAQVTAAVAHGFTVARTANRVGDANDRYALIQGSAAAGTSVVVRGTVARPAAATATPTAGTGTGTGATGGGGTSSGSGTPAAGGGAPRPSGTPAPAGGGTPAPAAGGGAPAPAAGGGTPAPAGGGLPIPQQPPMGVKLAFRLQKVEQIEDKSVTLEYNRQDSVQRSYAPQGLIGLLADDLDGPPHFIEVDLDSPFFRQLDISVDGPPAFEQIGLMKADVAIEYGRGSDPVGVKHTDLSFRPGGPRNQKVSFFLNPKRDLGYNLTLQYHFDPLSGWDGEKLSYDLPPITSLDRTLLVNPFANFGFLEVRVVPGDLDADMIDSTDVQLHYEDPGRWSRDKLITLRPAGGMQSWKLRLTDPNRRGFSYKLVHHLKDGTTRETGKVLTDIPLVTVNDPFQEPLVIELFPNYTSDGLKLLIVDVTYEDPGFTRKRAQQVRFLPDETDSKRVRFARTDASAGAFTMQLTILGIDNSVRRLPAVTLESPLVFLGEFTRLETSLRSYA